MKYEVRAFPDAKLLGWIDFEEDPLQGARIIWPLTKLDRRVDEVELGITFFKPHNRNGYEVLTVNRSKKHKRLMVPMQKLHMIKNFKAASRKERKADELERYINTRLSR